MKRLSLSAAALLLFAGAACAQDATPLTLEEAITRALESSPRLEQARSGVAGARAALRGARAEGMPQAGLNAGGRFQGPSVSIQVPRTPGTPAPRGGGGSFNPPRTAEVSADVSVPLYTGGRVSAGKRAARQQEQAALAREEAEAQRLVLDVTEAYLDSLQAGQQTRLAEALRGLNQERLRIARIRNEAGIGVPLEVSQAEADLATSIQQQIESSARQRQANAALNALIGQPAATPLALAALPATEAAPAPAPGALPGPAQQPLTPEQARAAAVDRPDLRALRADTGVADARIDQARAARRPFVSLAGNMLRRFPETLLGGFVWSLGASLVQTLFDGGRSRSQVEAARAERLRTGAVLAEAERLADQQVEHSLAALEAAEKRLAAEDRRVAAAVDALETTRKRFRAGLIPQVQVTEAETVVTRAQTDAVTARFEAARARVRLAYTAGRAYPQTVAPEGATGSSRLVAVPTPEAPKRKKK